MRGAMIIPPTHRWDSAGSSGDRCSRCGMYRYYSKGKRVFSLNGYRIKSGRHTKTPPCPGEVARH